MVKDAIERICWEVWRAMPVNTTAGIPDEQVRNLISEYADQCCTDADLNESDIRNEIRYWFETRL